MTRHQHSIRFTPTDYQRRMMALAQIGVGKRAETAYLWLVEMDHGTGQGTFRIKHMARATRTHKSNMGRAIAELTAKGLIVVSGSGHVRHFRLLPLPELDQEMRQAWCSLMSNVAEVRESRTADGVSTQSGTGMVTAAPAETPTAFEARPTRSGAGAAQA